jgi:benzoyl-CoA reductase/2-hydroxyglutaryl-CoA dehydratase subunit BcrC/BadD/HgdB
MTLKELLGSGALLVALLATLIEISPIKIDPWSKLAKWIGRAINGDVITKVDKLESDIKKMQDDAEEREAKECRARILRFGDEILHSQKHSKEHFDQILQDITEYEKYCEEHKDFHNNMTIITTKTILEAYEKCLHEHSFL